MAGGGIAGVSGKGFKFSFSQQPCKVQCGGETPGLWSVFVGDGEAAPAGDEPEFRFAFGSLRASLSVSPVRPCMCLPA